MKLNFSEPKISTGGVDVNKWSSLTKAERTRAIDKDWFVYFSFRNPTTGKLKKQPFIKGGVNRLKTKKKDLPFLRSSKGTYCCFWRPVLTPIWTIPTLNPIF